MPFPNFIVMGAARAGTTSLHHYLGQHPQVFMCPVKEPNFFAFDGELGDLRGPGTKQLAEHTFVDREAYLELFSGVREEIAVGEVSPRYMIAGGCAKRIHDTLPDARLIAILRQPVERAWASFTGHRKDGWETCDNFREAFEAEPARIAAGQSMGLHFSAGRYADQLADFISRFDRGRIRIVLYDDLKADPAALLSSLFGFLGVDRDFELDLSRRYNPSGEISNPGLALLWRRTENLRRSTRRLIPQSWRDHAYGMISDTMTRPELPPELRVEFTEFFRDDILRLSDLVDRDLSHWLEERA